MYQVVTTPGGHESECTNTRNSQVARVLMYITISHKGSHDPSMHQNTVTQ